MSFIFQEDYELLKEIGHGGFGVVWKARCKRNGSYVAIKAVRQLIPFCFKPSKFVVIHIRSLFASF